MTRPPRPPGTDAFAVGLRAWARGLYPLEAAVEVLIGSGLHRRIAAFGGVVEFWTADRSGDPWAGVDWEALAQDADAGPWSGGERRLLLAAAAIAGEPVPFDVAGLDEQLVRLVLDAVAHTAGWHEHGGAAHVTGRFDEPAAGGEPLPSFEDIRVAARGCLSQARDWLHSDWRPGTGRAGAQAVARRDALQAIAAAKAALDAAAARGGTR